MTEWDGETERRAEYCPVHHIKCKEWEATDKEVKNRLPIWVATILLTIAIPVVGFNYFQDSQANVQILKRIDKHIDSSNKMLKKISHGTNEIALNQRKVMDKLEMEFSPLPHYDFD